MPRRRCLAVGKARTWGLIERLASSLSNVISPYPQRHAPNLTALPIAPLRAPLFALFALPVAGAFRKLMARKQDISSAESSRRTLSVLALGTGANPQHAFFACIGACSTACTVDGLQLLGPAGSLVGRRGWRGDNGSGGRQVPRAAAEGHVAKSLLPPYSSWP